MLNLFYDFIPVVLFFVAFKFYGIYTATLVGIVATAIQLVLTTIWKKKLDRKQLLTLVIFVVFGGMTLYFHNPIFVKWKPSVIFWVFGLVFLISQFVGKKPIIQRMMEPMVEEKSKLPASIWRKMNLSWSIFFITLGTINIFIAYHFSTDTWVNFKLYGILGAIIIFSFLQAICLSKHMTDAE
jgi:intracellular septation protein